MAWAEMRLAFVETANPSSSGDFLLRLDFTSDISTNMSIKISKHSIPTGRSFLRREYEYEHKASTSFVLVMLGLVLASLVSLVRTCTMLVLVLVSLVRPVFDALVLVLLLLSLVRNVSLCLCACAFVASE